MRVKELIAKLQMFDGELPILVGDREGWYYEVASVHGCLVDEGQQVSAEDEEAGLYDESAETCVVLEAC